MDNKTIAKMLKTVVAISQKEEFVYEYDKLLGCDRSVGKMVVTDGVILKFGVETIIEMLESEL